MTAGFEVRDGKVTACATILKKLVLGPQQDKWISRAIRISEVEIDQWAIKEHPNK